MDSGKPTLNIIHSPTALDELAGIWRWNAERFGIAHADAYLRFLNETIGGLGSNYAKGRIVDCRPDLRYVMMRRRSKGHGHIAVYRFDENEVHVLHIFHTAQDWQNKLIEENLSPPSTG